jgi:hypothetical protein
MSYWTMSGGCTVLYLYINTKMNQGEKPEIRRMSAAIRRSEYAWKTPTMQYGEPIIW